MRHEDRSSTVSWTVDGFEFEVEIGADESRRISIQDWAIGVVSGVEVVLDQLDPVDVAAAQRRAVVATLPNNVRAFRLRCDG